MKNKAKFTFIYSMSGLSFHEKQHILKLLQQQGSVKYIYDEFVRKIGVHMTNWANTGLNDVWVRSANIEKAIENELAELHKKLLKNIDIYSSDAWKRSNVKTDDLVNSFIKELPISDVVKNGMFARNAEILKTFMNRKIDGLDLSDRVWKVTGTARQNIEYYLGSGLATGRPASLISQDVRQLLQDPDKRFHRIRNSNGKLVASAPMKDYNPGTGVYRSSYKNALRLAVTNTNEIYRLTDHERWQNLEFVLGIDIRRSSSNSGPCVICDSMVGRYPKDYVYKGWHPFCICPATPVLMKEDDFLDALVNDDFSNAKYIQDLPANGRKYLSEQLDKNKISTKSYLIKDNSKYFDQAVQVNGNGSLNILHGVNRNAKDYQGVLRSAKLFANQGKKVEILPSYNTTKDKAYQEIFGKLKGTKFYGKCPDLRVDGFFIEHEATKRNSPKRNLSNMFTRGFGQSDRIIIEDCGHKTWYYKKRVYDYIRDNKAAHVSEVWLLKDNELIQLYKKAEAK